MNQRLELILYYLYRFRFLNRTQIQKILQHRFPSRVAHWLTELSATGYIRRYYNSKTVTIPAVYSLGLNGRKYLKQSKLKDVNITLLDRVWREQTLSEQFRAHCLLVADIYLSLLVLTKKTGASLNFKTKTDLNDVKDLINPYPDAYFSLTETTGSKKRYFMDIFDVWPPRMQLRKRVNQYVDYYQGNFWQNHQTDPFPLVILVCPEEKSKKYLSRYIPKKLGNGLDLHFYLSSWGQIKDKGLTAEVLQKVGV